MKQKIEDMIAEALVREDRERKVGEYYASEMPFCIRRNYYLYKKPKKFPLGTLKIFASGTLVHDWFAEKVFSKSETVETHEAEGSLVYEEDGWQIRGRFDNLIKMKLDGKVVVIEIKSTMNNRFVKEPKNHHKEQLNFYLYKLGMESGYLLYVDRRNLSFKVYEVKFDKKMLEETLVKARILHKALLTSIRPSAEAKLSVTNKWQCNYCLYRQECVFDEEKQKFAKDSM